MGKVNDRNLGALSSKTINNSDDHEGGQHGSFASIDSPVRYSTPPTGGAISPVISQSHHGPSTLSVSTDSSLMALSVSKPQSKDLTSAIVKQSSGIPGLGNTILFSPRQFPTFSSSVNVDRPAKRRRLASPPSQGLIFNFGLASNASRNEFSPPSTDESGKDTALERPEVAQAAQIDFSELSDEAKAIMGYTTEKSVVNEQVLSASKSRLYEGKALAPRAGESTIDRAIATTSPDLAAEIEAVTELKNNTVSHSLSSEELQIGKVRRRSGLAVATKGFNTGRQYLQLSKEQRTQRGNAVQLAAEIRAKQLVVALAGSETDDNKKSIAPWDHDAIRLPTTRHTSSPLTSILNNICRDPAPIKRVHFLTFEKLISHTVTRLQRYTAKRTSGPMLSMSFALVHSSLLNPLLTPATLIDALGHFKGLVKLLLIELNRFVRAAEAKLDSDAEEAQMMAYMMRCRGLSAFGVWCLSMVQRRKS
ncbi:hypothetical protein D6D01_02974, partial [Aureobasidium pullulans]